MDTPRAPWHARLYNRLDNVAGALFCRLFGHWIVRKKSDWGDAECPRCHLYVRVGNHTDAELKAIFKAVVPKVRWWTILSDR